MTDIAVIGGEACGPYRRSVCRKSRKNRYQSLQAMSFFYALFNLRKLLYIIILSVQISSVITPPLIPQKR